MKKNILYRRIFLVFILVSFSIQSYGLECLEGIFGKRYLRAISCAANTSSSLSAFTLPKVDGGKPLVGIPSDLVEAHLNVQKPSVVFSYHDKLLGRELMVAPTNGEFYESVCEGESLVITTKNRKKNKDYSRWIFTKVDDGEIELQAYHRRIAREIGFLFFTVLKEETVDNITCLLKSF